MRTASCGLRTYARRRYDYFRDRTYRWPAFFSIPGSALYSLASVLATPWVEFRLAQTLRLLPALTVETPQGTQLWKKLAAKLGANPKRIHCIPHPIQTDIFRPNPSVRKRDQIISVGRWGFYQKNFPLLLETLLSFLSRNPGWTALIVGSGLPPHPRYPRIRFCPPLAARRLARAMQSSKIFLSSSRYESFGLAAAEAALCGCRVIACNPGILPVEWQGYPDRKDARVRLDEAARRPLSAKARETSLKIVVSPIHVAKKFLRAGRFSLA